MVSVIVPAYNVERYIAACIDSVRAQTFADWELILVDDGSTDGTAAICDRYAATDARIRCLHQANRGVAAARNAALECIRGEFVLFLDGDDRLSPELIARLLACMDADVDIACCSFTAVRGDQELVRRSFLIGDRDMRGMAEKEPLFLQLQDGRIGQAPGRTYTAIGVPWGKLYRASLIQEGGLRFPPMKYLEDNIFNMYAFTLARRIVYRDEPLYRYRIDHCTSYKLLPEPRMQALAARDEYYERYGSTATEAMQRSRNLEKQRFLGASCKYYARTLPRREAAKAIRALCAQPIYAQLLREAPAKGTPARYRLLRTLIRLRFWPGVAAVCAKFGK